MKFHIKVPLMASAVIIVAALGLQSCHRDKIYRIGVSQCSQDDWRSKMNGEIEREIMFHEDAEAEIRSADDNNEKQIADIRYFADNGFDIIIVSPNEAAALTPVIKEVYERGIPVVIFDRNIIGDSYTARIGVDDVGLGRSAAHYAVSRLGHGAKAIEIFGRPGSTPAEDRHKGFSTEFVASGGRLLGTVIGNWNNTDPLPRLDSLLDANPDADLIYAHNDRMAIGASQLARSKGRDDIMIVGIDAAPEIGIRAVADSVIDATFLYPTEGHRLIRTALAILKGQPYEKETILPVSSAVDSSNADILLLQDKTLMEETGKMKILKSSIDDYWARHNSQTVLFYAAIAILALMAGVVFLVLRLFWSHKRHQKILLAQNRELEEQRDTEKRLNLQLREATQSKLTFFTNVSHDLRTPLTLIAEPVALMARADNVTPAQRNMLQLADKNVRILRRLINQILDFRKYENDKLQLNLEETDIGAAVADWLESFQSLARQRHLKLRLHSAPKDGENASMAIDREKMERVVFNLISNAIKYTPDGGSIDVYLDMRGDSLVLRVADTGEGIGERDLGNIFDRFYQADRVHPRGSGIGLALCKAFVELHGGTISVESELKRGSVFTVEIPVRHVAGEADEYSKRIESADVESELGDVVDELVTDDGKPLLLVIDDNQDIRSLIGILMGKDYNVISAPNGAEGIRRAVKYVPDLIICDVMMPVMDGLECCRRLKEEPVTSHIPVLMLTACSMDEQRVQGYESGADGYLSKPFGTEVLVARCASLISNRKRIKALWVDRQNGAAEVSAPVDTAETQGSPKKPGKQAQQKRAALPAGDIDDEFYSRFLEIFNAEIGNAEIGIDEIASRLGLERTQFYRKIKALTNFSPVELIRTLRLREGQRLVKATAHSMSEIAYTVGFSTPAYFTKCYREAFGETPTETRARTQGR